MDLHGEVLLLNGSMGKQLSALNQRLIHFINEQKLFFVATTSSNGSINLSPKGLDSFKVMDDNRVLWLNLTGSGNETAAHLIEDSRMTIMFCAFEGPPLILRLYGTAVTYHPRHGFWKDHISLFPKIGGSRQLVDMKIDLVQTSCGMGVPLMDFKSQRHGLIDWAEDKGEEGIKEYWEKKNTISLDGNPTNIFKNKPQH